MSNLNELKPVGTITPFTKFCCTIGNLPSSYMASFTYEEQLLWLCDYLQNTVIPAVNTNAEAVAELQELYVQLHDYVEHYFDNLDVQEEINNKLDEMAENGKLENLIQPFLNNFQIQINNQNIKISDIDKKVQAATNGSPLSASSIEEMTDTSKIYVNTTNGNWYYYNGETWVSGGVYQGMDLDQYYKNILFDTQAETTKIIEEPSINGYLDVRGYFTENTVSKHTNYIPVNNFNTIEYQTFLNEEGFEIGFFDEDKKLLNDISIIGNNSSSIKTISIPFNAKFVVLSYYNYSGLSSPYIKLYKNNSIKTKIDSLFNDNYNILDNINFLNSEITEKTEKPSINGFLTNKGIFDKTSKAKHTDYITIDNYDTIQYQTYLNNTGYELAFFDINKKLLSESSILGNESVTLKNTNIPNNAKYVMLSYYSTSTIPLEKAFIKLYKNNSLINKIDNFFNTSPLKDKNILIFGDSITDCCNFGINFENKTTTSYSFKNPSNSFVNSKEQTINYSMWPKLLRDLCAPLEVRNYAKSGARIVTFQNSDNTDNLRQNLSYQVDLSLNDLTNPNDVFKVSDLTPDIIIFAIGTNDGTPNDTYDIAMEKTVDDSGYVNVEETLSNLDTTYFNQALRYNFLRLKNKFPYAQFYFVLPIQRRTTKNLDEQKILDITKMCKAYSINIIDGAAQIGIISDLSKNVDIYFKDGLHPNDKGQNLMARTIIKTLENNYMDMSQMNS